MMKVIGRHVPPQVDVRSPLEWGTEERLVDLLNGVESLDASDRQYVFRHRSSQDWLDTLRTYYGADAEGLRKLNDIASKSLEDELLDLTARSNSAHSWHVVRPE